MSQSAAPRRKSLHSDMPHDANRRTSDMSTSTFFERIEDAVLRPSNSSSRGPCIFSTVIPPTVAFSARYYWRKSASAVVMNVGILSPASDALDESTASEPAPGRVHAEQTLI